MAHKANAAPVDITDKTNEAAITLLCTFDELVSTKAGTIEWSEPDKRFLLTPTTGKMRKFDRASGAVEVLRRMTK